MTLNAKTRAQDLNSNFRNKNLDTQALALASMSYVICFNSILRSYLNKKLNFYHQILMRNAQMYTRLENLVYENNLLLILKYNRNHQYNTQ